MSLKLWIVGSLGLSCASIAYGQASLSASKVQSKPARTPYYIDTKALDLDGLLMDPPAAGSSENQQDLSLLHQIEAARTPAMIAQAQADENQENMFAFQSVLGPHFTPENLPITAALGAHVKNEQSVAGGILKNHFQRPRPFQVDNTLHPVCRTKPTHDSYPSGHALTGYLEALTLAEMLPEKRDQLLARADEYAHNRAVCGVHYVSDVEASRSLAYAIFGYMLATPKFQQDLAASRDELRAKLNTLAAQN